MTRSRCRFISSYDGVSRCRHSEYAQDFCRFHYRAYLAGEITVQGYLVDGLSDQVRRRAINYHGIQPPAVLVGPGSPPAVSSKKAGAAG
ncbi:MAG: hypothetical protein ACE5HD_07565 [Acidobacteriota bacterium]